MCTVSRALTSNSIGHGNRVHETSSNRGRLERSTTFLSKPDLDRLLNKALQAPSVGGGCVIPITVPYYQIMLVVNKNFVKESGTVTSPHNASPANQP